MKTNNPGAQRKFEEIAAWVARQSEAFEVEELCGRFNLIPQRACRILSRLVKAGLARVDRPKCGQRCGSWARAK